MIRIEKPENLSICTFLWNEQYFLEGRGREYVNKLYNAVSRNLSLPFRFFLFAEWGNHNRGLHKNIIVIPIEHVKVEYKTKDGQIIKKMIDPTWRKNLRKLLAYNPNNGLTGRVLMFDLDVVITRNIDHIVQYEGRFITCGPGIHNDGMGGSVVSFKAGDLIEELWYPILRNTKNIEQRTRGRERNYYQWRLGVGEYDNWDELYPRQIMSYKNCCKSGYPEGAKIIYFHGKPKPHEKVNVGWIKDHWR